MNDCCCAMAASVESSRDGVIRYDRLSHECWRPLNAADIAAVAGDACEFILYRAAGGTWVGGSDCMAVL